MFKIPTIAVLAVVLAGALTDSIEAVSPKRARILRDGFALSGVDGKVAGQNDKWFFELNSDVSDERGFVLAGTGLQLLPSSTLEKMAADANSRSAPTCRIWATVTEYRNKNFIFPSYFLRLGKVTRTEPSASQKATPTAAGTEQTAPVINDPNDAFAIPEEILEKLKTGEFVRVERLQKQLGLKQDSMLADRTGFIIEQEDGRALFIPDALGRNVQKISFNLLPCQVLERAERKQSAEPELIRFKIAGILTKYKGKYYLLLQRAVRVYSHGNFAK